jgi:5-methyltetrahydrofolate--homocysteine methyltransferase
MAEMIVSMAEHCSLPLLAQPNAGAAALDRHGETVYKGSPDEMAAAAWALRQAGAQFIGSCCGSTPSYTAAIYAAVGNTDVVPRPAIPQVMSLAAPRKLVTISLDDPCRLLGENLNPSGKEKLAESLVNGDTSEAVSLVIDEVVEGAELIDVNVGASATRARELLPSLVEELAFSCKAPLVLDCLDAEALEAALRIYPGRALVNSINADAETLARLLPIAKRYGAAVIAQAFDGKQLPTDSAARLQALEKIRTAAHEAGFSDDDLLFDVLVLPEVKYPTAKAAVLETIAALKEQGLLSVAAISNISYGGDAREQRNADFAAAALAAGLTVAIANPFQKELRTVLGQG